MGAREIELKKKKKMEALRWMIKHLTRRQTAFFHPEIKSSGIIFFTLESNFDEVVSESASNVIYYL